MWFFPRWVCVKLGGLMDLTTKIFIRITGDGTSSGEEHLRLPSLLAASSCFGFATYLLVTGSLVESAVVYPLCFVSLFSAIGIRKVILWQFRKAWKQQHPDIQDYEKFAARSV